jgi:hypothetical protein
VAVGVIRVSLGAVRPSGRRLRSANPSDRSDRVAGDPSRRLGRPPSGGRGRYAARSVTARSHPPVRTLRARFFSAPAAGHGTSGRATSWRAACTGLDLPGMPASPPRPRHAPREPRSGWRTIPLPRPRRHPSSIPRPRRPRRGQPGVDSLAAPRNRTRTLFGCPDAGRVRSRCARPCSCERAAGHDWLTAEEPR